MVSKIRLTGNFRNDKIVNMESCQKQAEILDIPLVSLCCIVVK